MTEQVHLNIQGPNPTTQLNDRISCFTALSNAYTQFLTDLSNHNVDAMKNDLEVMENYSDVLSGLCSNNPTIEDACKVFHDLSENIKQSLYGPTPDWGYINGDGRAMNDNLMIIQSQLYPASTSPSALSDDPKTWFTALGVAYSQLRIDIASGNIANIQDDLTQIENDAYQVARLANNPAISGASNVISELTENIQWSLGQTPPDWDMIKGDMNTISDAMSIIRDQLYGAG